VSDLRDRFGSLVQRLGGGAESAGEAAALLAAWAEPERRYHGTAHLRDSLERLDAANAPAAVRDLVEAALWFHDAVYDPLASDNEERSAAWARRALAALGVPAPTAAEVARLVLLTGHDAPPGDPAGRLLCDIDLSILGRAAEAFDAYDRQIRAEYAAVPDAAYRQGRRRVLTALLARDPLYGTEEFRARYERTARVNLRRAIERLDRPGN
jgi:predicted metal-dependent HD superfamily phosphohydrolase